MKFRVEDMSCGHCVASIRGAVEKVPGVVGVDVSLETKMVTVSSEGDPDGRGVIAAIRAAGFSPEQAD